MTDRQMDGLPHHLMPPYDGGIIRLRISALGKSEQSTVLPPQKSASSCGGIPAPTLYMVLWTQMASQSAQLFLQGSHLYPTDIQTMKH